MLDIRNVTKRYAQHKALDNVSLTINTGSIFGLLGPNGAGKTSLIRIINQITAPDIGEIWFENEKLAPKHISKIGYLPEERGLYKKMEIGEQMIYLARLKGLSHAEASKRIKYWFEKMEIQGWWKKKVEELSKGMQQKVQFVATVLHEPSLIILDEPFSGFDPINAELIKNEIIELNKNGATIIFSTHRMESVEEMCHNIGLINKSKKILDGDVKEVRKRYRKNIFKVLYAGSINDFSHPDMLPLDTYVGSDGIQHARFQLKEGTTANHLLKALVDKVEIYGLEEEIPSIHDIFVMEVKEIQS